MGVVSTSDKGVKSYRRPSEINHQSPAFKMESIIRLRTPHFMNIHHPHTKHNSDCSQYLSGSNMPLSHSSTVGGEHSTSHQMAVITHSNQPSVCTMGELQEIEYGFT